MWKKLTSFCQVWKNMHTKEIWFFFPPHGVRHTQNMHLTAETLHVEIAVKDDDSHRFIVAGVARRYGKTTHAAARCKFPVNTNTDA